MIPFIESFLGIISLIIAIIDLDILFFNYFQQETTDSFQDRQLTKLDRLDMQ